MYLPAPVRNDKRILKFPILSARKPAEKNNIFYFNQNDYKTFKFLEELETRIIKFVKELEKNYKATKIVKMHRY